MVKCQGQCMFTLMPALICSLRHPHPHRRTLALDAVHVHRPIMTLDDLVTHMEDNAEFDENRIAIEQYRKEFGI